MKNSEIRALTEAELLQKIASEKETLQKLKFAHAVSPIENPNKIVETKKLILPFILSPSFLPLLEYMTYIVVTSSHILYIPTALTKWTGPTALPKIN